MGYGHGVHDKPNHEKRIAAIRKRLEPRDSLIVQKRLEDRKKKQSQIAAEVNKELRLPEDRQINKNTVYSVLHREDVQPMLERAYLKLAGVVEETVDRVIRTARQIDDPDSMESFEVGREMYRASWEANKLIAQAHGLLPTNQQSVYHNTFISQTNNQIVSPLIAELMAKHFGSVIDIPVQTLITQTIETVQEAETD